MKRVLCIVGKMSADGAETYLMKLMRNIDRDLFQMDFCVATQEEAYYDKEIISLGGKIFRVPPKTKGFWKNFNGIKKIVRENKYEYVLRVSQHSLSAVELFAAKMGGAKIRAFRSSNTKTCGGRMNTLIHYIFRPIANLFSNVKIAPSTDSAIFMFGKRTVRRKKFVLLPNALDFGVYRFSEKDRRLIRKELNISNDTFVLSNIGRLNYQKNQKFLLDVFSDFKRIVPNSKLLIVGDGELKNELFQHCVDKNIENAVAFLGVRNDVPSILSSSDVFLFPSLFEGMPNTVIEAEANGLKCLVSDTITSESNITGNVRFLPINDKGKWVQALIDEKQNDYYHHDYRDSFQKRGYLITDAVKTFKTIIFGDEQNEQ